ncbi:MAG: SDR family oxidoreductase [Aestuariivirga sp.]|uniref:SDR family NAD(P)-dependent oxidoreductase n=1 Tax=Aestuariivirga sp. TaxID=2650926 RepID=UPI003017CC91
MILETFNDCLFEGKTALVTGSASGIGAGIARCFAKLGATVLLQDMNSAGLRSMAKDLGSAKGGVAILEGDLSTPGVADTVFDNALRISNKIDFLVNNAGRSSAATTQEITEETTQALIELNLKSVIFLSKRFAAHAREHSGGGSIIQISSTAGIVGFERRAVYSATKFAVIGLMKVLALDHARDGIRVNAVLPHVVETEMFQKTAKKNEIDLWRAGIPMGRFATTEDIGALVMFLCSPAAAYLTGGVYPVDGGAMAGPFGGDA